MAGIMSEGSNTGDNAPIIPLSKAYVRPHRKDSLQKSLAKTKRNHGQEYVSKSSGNYSLFARLVKRILIFLMIFINLETNLQTAFIQKHIPLKGLNGKKTYNLV